MARLSHNITYYSSEGEPGVLVLLAYYSYSNFFFPFYDIIVISIEGTCLKASQSWDNLKMSKCFQINRDTVL